MEIASYSRVGLPTVLAPGEVYRCELKVLGLWGRPTYWEAIQWEVDSKTSRSRLSM